MMQELLKQLVAVYDGGTAGTAAISVASTGVKAEFHPMAPVRILKWGIVAATAIESAAAATQLSLILRTAPLVSAGQVTVDTLTLGANATSPNSVLAVGNGAYRDPWTVSTTATTPASQVGNAGPEGDQGTFPIVSGQQQLTLSAGQALALNVVTAPDVQGTGILFVEYVLLPISKPSGYGFTTDPDFASQPGSVSLTDNFTRFAS